MSSRDYLALAKTAAAQPFRFESNRKEALDYLNRAYEQVRDREFSGLCKIPHEERTAEWHVLADNLPYGLHQVREKHLKLAPSNTADKIRELIALRDEIKARPIEPKVAKARTYTKADGAVVKYDPSHPVAKAIEPMKIAAQNDAEAVAANIASKVYTEISDANGDLDIAAPAPRRDATEHERNSLNDRRALFGILCRPEGYPARWFKDESLCARFIDRARREAGEQFEAFAHKLIAKVGEAASASIIEHGVWEWSILTVTKPDGSVQRWKTQRIVNRSYKGTFFYQWPTRLLK